MPSFREMFKEALASTKSVKYFTEKTSSLEAGFQKSLTTQI